MTQDDQETQRSDNERMAQLERPTKPRDHMPLTGQKYQIPTFRPKVAARPSGDRKIIRKVDYQPHEWIAAGKYRGKYAQRRPK